MMSLRGFSLVLALLSASSSTCRNSAATGEASPPAKTTESVEIASIDTGSLTPRERKDWSTAVSELLAPCPNEPVSIAQCIREHRKCEKCLPAAKLLLKQVRDGRSPSQAEEAYRARFSPDRIKSVDPSESPFKGAASAPATLVEFADFECPHCRLMAPLLEKFVDDHRDSARLVFKFYPLQAHAHGEAAARAAVAAMKQGKFWEMHHKLFENQQALEPRDLERYAKEIGLDMAKFRVDLEAEATADRVARDRKQGDVLGINGTPSIFINGREFDMNKFKPDEDLEEWVKLEAELARGPAPASKDAVAK